MSEREAVFWIVILVALVMLVLCGAFIALMWMVDKKFHLGLMELPDDGDEFDEDESE